MAETTRFILRYGGLQYTDELIWGHVFATRRAAGEFPFDKVPVLQLKEGTLAQSERVASAVEWLTANASIYSCIDSQVAAWLDT